tara:strand:+ start:581 stop:1342 length:762 start_codon:yes stop_codon:yes gene_type:complete
MKDKFINFENSLFYYEPFPHSVTNNFLSPDVYNEICNEFPSDEEFVKMKDKHLGENKFDKFNFSNLGSSKNKFFKYLGKTRSLKFFFDYINSDKFFQSLNNFFINNHVDLGINQPKSFKNLVKKIFQKDINFSFEFSSIPVQNGFIKPHTDGPNNIIGFVIPIIDNEEIFNYSNLGTKILKSNSNEFKYNNLNRTVPYEKTELVREMPFEKNCMIMHVKTFNSLHAVGPIQPKSNLSNQKIFRKSITMFLKRE